MYNNKRLALNIFWVILGAVLIGLTVAEILKPAVIAGMGGALMGVGILRILRITRYKKDPDYRTRVDTEIGDERNSFLRMKSWAWTGYIVILVEGIGMIIALILGQHMIQLILSYSVCLILAVYWIVYVILSRKY